MSQLLKYWVPRTFKNERVFAFLAVAGTAFFEFAFGRVGIIASFGQLDFAADSVGSLFSCAFLALTLWFFYRFIFLAFTSKPGVRVIILALFAVILYAEYSYLRSIGRFTAHTDITYALGTNSSQKSDTIAAFSSFAWLPVFAIILGTSIYFLIRESHRTTLKELLRDVGVILFGYLGLYFLFPLLAGQAAYSSSFDAFAQTAINYAISGPTAIAAPPVRTTLPTFAKPDTAPGNNVIVLFDESVNGRHLSLNGYSRPTTPFLKELEKAGILKNFGVASSTYTSSQPSYDSFIVGANDEMLDTLSPRDRMELPTIFQYAKAMGYRTWYLDGQMKDYWGGIADDKQYIDQIVTLAHIDPDRVEDYERNNGSVMTDENQRPGLKQWDIDLILAERVRSLFESSTGNFVFVYKRGIHFPYEKNYPAENAMWQPIYKFTSQWESPPAEAAVGIANSYDNALLYGLDPFFKKLGVDHPLPNNTVIVYTSDHGETFASNGRAGHGGDSIDEASIPLFIIGLEGRKIGSLTRAEHPNIFSTLLDLMNVPKNARNSPYSPSLFDDEALDHDRYYRSGDGRRNLFEK